MVLGKRQKLIFISQLKMTRKKDHLVFSWSVIGLAVKEGDRLYGGEGQPDSHDITQTRGSTHFFSVKLKNANCF